MARRLRGVCQLNRLANKFAPTVGVVFTPFGCSVEHHPGRSRVRDR
ncbi:hypothetical protein QCD79_07505 [Pseudomonas quasicaspiana]|nr:hypothetical protein [Pseudomonas quasicaspiana]